MEAVYRVYAVKKAEYAIEAQSVEQKLYEELGLSGIRSLRIFNRYDIQGLPEAYLERASRELLAEPPLDDCYINVDRPWTEEAYVLAVEALPGQFDQRADSAAQCLQFLTSGARSLVRCAKVYVFSLAEPFTPAEEEQLKRFLINPVENREADLARPATLVLATELPPNVALLPLLPSADGEARDKLYQDLGLAMSPADFQVVQAYYREECRIPTLTEIRVLDTYWSDHCRHTTFHTQLSEPQFVAGEDTEESRHFCAELEASYGRYRELRREIYGDQESRRPLSLMDLGTLGAKVLAHRGLIPDLDKSEEINACSVHVTLQENGQDCDYLLMFKNETHNHPTEIEPFGGAATCLGGAIRDPLSGRSYVYQAMRVTGAADPRTPLSETLPGKLSQRNIVTNAARGYSSYGNQIGLSTGLVRELYHPDYVAKRMEVGAVIGSAPADQVVRETPEPGDVIVLLGGRTGRDGIGGATGSSREHDIHSVKTSAAEVQKGNPPEERKIQRLFRRPEVSRLIRRCNDFGAGGVSVAIGELADSLDIDLDKVPLKYEGLDGTEIAISESQERMAVVLAKEDVDAFCLAADEENLEATIVAHVTDSGRLRMYWRGERIVDLARSFIDSSGAPQFADVRVVSGREALANSDVLTAETLFEDLRRQAADLTSASQQGLGEMFDSSIGAGTVLQPYGGRTQRTPENIMASLIPLRKGVSTTASLMSFGFVPDWTKRNPYQGSYLAVLDSLAKLWAAGADPERIRLSFQEYFPATRDSSRWGLPFQALLGALDAQIDFSAPAIGGKDSMSGTFGEKEVPPTLISFAVGTAPAGSVKSRCLLAEDGASLFLLDRGLDRVLTGDKMPLRWSQTEVSSHLEKITRAVHDPACLAASSLEPQGLLYSLFTMALGNQVGVALSENFDASFYTAARPGAVLVEAADPKLKQNLLEDGWIEVASVRTDGRLSFENISLDFEALYGEHAAVLERIFPQQQEASWSRLAPKSITRQDVPSLWLPKSDLAKPQILIPVFPGTNCEFDSANAFERAGGRTETLVLRNQSQAACNESLDRLADAIDQAQILYLPGGFSGGDEPEGSAKFITAVMRNSKVMEAIDRLYRERDGLILGICNGFQALIKLGLLPGGSIGTQSETSPTLTFNQIGRHISTYVYTRIVHNDSPWLRNLEAGDIHLIPVSHGEGRLVADEETLRNLWANKQVAAQYVDDLGQVSLHRPFNPNGSVDGIEALLSPDGRILGKMGHSERWNPEVARNIPGVGPQDIFSAGVAYFRG